MKKEEKGKEEKKKRKQKYIEVKRNERIRKGDIEMGEWRLFRSFCICQKSEGYFLDGAENITDNLRH